MYQCSERGSRELSTTDAKQTGEWRHDNTGRFEIKTEKVWKSAVQTNDKKNSAGILISETRKKKTLTNHYCIGIHTNITQLYTKTYCWQHNTILYENIKVSIVLLGISNTKLCVSGGGGRSIVLGTHFLSRLVANVARLIQILRLTSGKVLPPQWLTTGYFIRNS
jgi:hypothetical protein